MVSKKDGHKSKARKNRDLRYFGAVIAIIALINYIGTQVFDRLDLTSENRYSLTEATIDQLEGLDDMVFVRVYLSGDLPPKYERLRDATQELLDEFRAYAGDNVQYEFINPSAGKTEEERVSVYRELSKQGLRYNNVRYKDGDKMVEKIVFPGAILAYQGKEQPLQLMKSQVGVQEEVMLNNSIQQLEYEFATTINMLTQYKTQSIAFIQGHGELDKYESAAIAKSLNGLYGVERVKINGQLNALDNFDAIVIAKPDSAFSEKDKFIIDQFIMGGGKAIWLVENVQATMDSLRNSSTTMGIPKDLNLADQLFRYGVRINSDLIQDLRAMPLPIVTGYVGNQPRQEVFPWFFSPMIMPSSDHPVVKNLDAIKTEFISTIDTVGGPGIEKTVLLTSSENTKVVRTPTRISFNMLRQEPDKTQFNKGPQPVAVLLEGEFESNFTNRIPRQIMDAPEIGFKEKSIPNKMIVVSDGNIMKNDFNRRTGEFKTLGFDQYSRRVYGNESFLMNCFNYLLDDSGLIQARTKEFKIRLLDPEKAKEEKNQWQVTNTALPVIVIVLFGIAQFYMRRKKYSTKPNTK